MTEYVEVAGTDDLREGTMKKFSVAGREILIARTGGRYFCTDNTCPHLGGDLSQGVLAGTVITCPMHHSRFDLTDGRVIRWTDLSGIFLTVAKNQRPPRPLPTHPVKVKGGRILVGL